MACSCKSNNSLKNAVFNRSRNGNIIRPVNRQAEIIGVPNSGNNNSMALKAAVTPTAERSSSGDVNEKKKTQKIRRDAIRRALNK